MRFISARAWGLVIFSAGLQLLSFPLAGPLPIWRSFFCWIALVPFLLALFMPDTSGKRFSLKQSFYTGYLCGFLWYIGNCYWIYQTMYLYGGLPKIISLGILILFALYLGLYHAAFAVLVTLSRKFFRELLIPFMLVPCFWVAIELARARITGFPWDLLGYSQIDSAALMRLAPVTGVMGISFFIAAINVAIVPLFMGRARRRFIAPVVAASLVCIASLPIGVMSGDNPVEKTSSTAVMMQENLEVGAQGRDVKPMSEASELDGFAAASMQVVQQHATNPAVVIWPEAPSHLRSDEPLFRERMGALAKMVDAPLIIGSLGVDFDNSSPRGYFLYDSASLFDATGNYQGRYDKIHLVPWGEYVPFKRFFAFAEKLTEGVGDMDPGHERKVFTTNGHSYGVFVCYESIFGDEVRQFAKNGAEVLVNISDDGWYGDTGAPWQHLNIARMRAVENRRWVLRSTNTGITTAIDPHGRTAYQAPRHVRGAFAFSFAFESPGDLTIYTRFGDWFAWLCVLVSVGALGFGASKTPLLQRAIR